MSELSDKALLVAINEIGMEEKPRGSNWGHPVQDYLASVGINFPASWCMAFVYWCFNQASKSLLIQTPLVKTGGVLHAYGMAIHNHHPNPQKGDIFIMDLGHGLGHTGIVEMVDGDVLHTVEGNTNDTGSREGYEVCRRTRQKSKIIGYLRY